MTLRFHTAHMSTKANDRLDITRGTGVGFGLTFAPSNDLVWPYIAKRQHNMLTDADWEEYSTRYTAEMRASYARSRAAWDALLSAPTATLCCWCYLPERCHRGVLASILVRLGAIYEGEMTNE